MIWFFIVPLILIAFIPVISRWAYGKAYRRARRVEDIYELPSKTPPHIAERTRSLIRVLDALPYEPVEIRSRDGLRLYARYYHIADGAPVHIQCHGYRSYAMRDFCGGGPLAHELGHNTLIIDQRAHGKSEGETITFGIMERYDVLCWIDYVIQRFGKDTPIFLTGVSMGAATVLMTTDLPLPKNVIGVIADCPDSSPRAIIRKVIADMKLPVTLAYPFAVLGALLFGKFQGLGKISAVNAVKHASVPILIIHGEADSFVPCDMSREIAAACASEIRLVTVPDADHAMSYMTDFDCYKNASHTFAKECLASFSQSK